MSESDVKLLSVLSPSSDSFYANNSKLSVISKTSSCFILIKGRFHLVWQSRRTIAHRYVKPQYYVL